MKLQHKIVLPSLLILSLIGFVGETAIPRSVVIFQDETEWLTTGSPENVYSGCFNSAFFYTSPQEATYATTWSEISVLRFNKEVSLKFTLQIKSTRKREATNLLVNKSHTPRNSIKEYPSFC